MSTLKAIIWDMDGVLVDSGEAHYHAWRSLLAERGYTLTQEQFAATFGMNNLPILRQWLGEEQPTDELVALGLRKEVLFRQLAREHVRLLPGVTDWLARCQTRGYRQAVASSGEMANIVAILGALDIANYFDALLAGAFLPRSKPDPAIFLQAAGSLNAQPAECLVIEDGIVGVEAARRAGMRCLAVTTTHPAEKLAGADWIVSGLADLSEATFDRLFA